ncbi:DNA-binding transcriptional regulator CytR [Acerihabitans arboris]|uniref:DNA-binding transcriptional regulator CytR n=1 Tax=Acerihabitans arboris TaxID=2691583 RepID=A0A845SLJ9_9GAMM|nr:DNA-binding transcriptional regulator CytR [Acerihabitans arboris]NDL64869.1 DNA-binding transcriptional regulator CytR [Acerihabitans arboris]
MEQKKAAGMATMKDVAEKAGVSTATVSRALMNPEKVSVTTRRKVQLAVSDVGYSPQPLGRQVKRNETRNLLAVVPDICDPFFSEILRGIEETADENGYLVLIADCAHQRPHKKSFSDLIIARQIDGMLLLGSEPPFAIDIAEQLNLPPMVMVNEFVPELALPTVHIDNLTAAYEAVDYLFSLGHRRIACISGPKHLTLCQYRVQGYIQALRRHGIPSEEHIVIQGDISYQTGATGLNALISRTYPPTAIFCHSDIIAFGVLSQAKKVGLDVPADLSLIGFDDITLARFCDPPLTTVAQPGYQLGREALLLLLQQLRQQAVTNTSLLLDSKLIVRGSTAMPRIKRNAL